jgi:hypothetical protein
VTNTSNETAWANSSVVENWMSRLDEAYRRQGVNIILLLDNLSSYKKAKLNLTNVSLAYFPANTTSLIQIADQEIVQNVRILYRKRVFQMRIESMKADLSDKNWEFTLFEAIKLLARTWDDVKTQTIVNCVNRALSFKRSIVKPPVFQHLSSLFSSSPDLSPSSSESHSHLHFFVVTAAGADSLSPSLPSSTQSPTIPSPLTPAFPFSLSEET